MFCLYVVDYLVMVKSIEMTFLAIIQLSHVDDLGRPKSNSPLSITVSFRLLMEYSQRIACIKASLSKFSKSSLFLQQSHGYDEPPGP